MNDGSNWVSLEEAAETLGIARDEIYAYLQRNLVLIHQSMHHGTYRAEVSKWDVERLRKRRELSSREPQPVTNQTRIWPRPSAPAKGRSSEQHPNGAAHAAPEPSAPEPAAAPPAEPTPAAVNGSGPPAAAAPAHAPNLNGSNGTQPGGSVAAPTDALPTGVSTTTNERLPDAVNALRRLRERRSRERAAHAEALAEMQRDRDAAVRELAQVEQHQTRLQKTIAMSERTERAVQRRCDRLETQLATAQSEIAALRTKLRCALARARQFERGASHGRD